MPTVDYLLTFTFYLDPVRARLIGLPEKLYDVKQVQTDGTKDSLVDAVNGESAGYLSYPNGVPKVGLSLRLNPSDMQDSSLIDLKRIFVFHNLICAISAETKRITPNVPELEDGKESVQ